MSLRRAGFIAGLFYLLNPVSFSEFYSMPRLVVADAGQTVANLQAHPHLFAWTVLAYFYSLVGDVVIAWALYVLLAPVNRALSLLTCWLRVVYAAVSIAASFQLATLYRLITRPEYGLPFGVALGAQAKMLVGSFRSGWSLGLVLFGLHLILLGWLMFRSTYLPRWLGVLLIVDGSAWIVDNLSYYLFPDAPLGWLNVCFLPELILMVWLLGWGSRLKEPELAV